MDGIVLDICVEASHHAGRFTPLQATCVVTYGGHVYRICDHAPIVRGSHLTVTPEGSPSKSPEAANCFTTIHGKVYDICDGADISTRGCRQLNAACLTTLTAHEGHVVVVDCGDGFESGYPPTITSPSPYPAKPTTVCIENRCFDVIGTFGSPASATATPTQTQSKDEL